MNPIISASSRFAPLLADAANLVDQSLLYALAMNARLACPIRSE